MRGSGGARAGRVVGLVLVLLVVTFAGCLDGDAAREPFGGPSRPAFDTGRAVVAVIDTGVNPYHGDFASSGRTMPAGELLPGYPGDGRTLSLSLDQADMGEATAADAVAWRAVTPGVLYDVPGTRIVGMIAFGEPEPHPDAPLVAPGLDENGHGTAALGMVAASCPECLLVSIETAGAADGRDALSWLVAQDWIDAVVYPARAGIGFVGAGVHATGDATFAWAKRNVEAGQLVVVASGNGPPELAGTGLAAAYTPARDVSYSYWTAGPDWVLTVGAVDPATREASAWHTYPVDVVAEGLDCDAPHPFDTKSRVPFSGTSCSAPVVGGQLGAVLVDVRTRLMDGATGPRSEQRLVVPHDVRVPPVTRADLTRVFLLEAGPIGSGSAPVAFHDPLDPSRWTVADGPLSPVHAGWGVHDADTLARVVRVLVGTDEAMAPDEREASWFPIDRRVRIDAWGAWDEGESRIAFPAATAGPVRAPQGPEQVTRLYEASFAGPTVPAPDEAAGSVRWT